MFLKRLNTILRMNLLNVYRAFWVALLLILPGFMSLHAEESANLESLRDELVQIKSGQPIKVVTQIHDTIIGDFQEITRDTLFLSVDTEQRRALIANIAALWVQDCITDSKPATFTGLGGVLGLGLAAIWRETSRTSGSQPGGGVYPILTIMSAGAGYILGTAFQKRQTNWISVYPSSEATSDTTLGKSEHFLATRETRKAAGSFGVFFGPNVMSHPLYKGKFSLHINYLVFLNRSLAVGPEIGFSQGEPKETNPPWYLYDKRFYHIKAVARVTLNKRAMPYLIAGVGSNLNQNETGYMYNVGAGYDFVILSNIALSAEIRWHDTFTSGGKPDILDMKAGVGLRW